jgi:Ca-activated chloride channel homolog
MKNYGKFAVLTIALLFFGAALFGLNSSTAHPLTSNFDDRAVVLPTPPPIDDDEVLKIDTELVNILFTAQDKDRRLLTTLKQEDVRILEDGAPQEIFAFYRQTDLPLSISILIDTSVSQERTLPYLKEAAKSFIENVVRPDKDEVSVLSFTGETTLEQDLTGNIVRLRRAVDRVKYIPPAGTASGVMIGTPPISGGNQRAAGSTAIWDAVWITSNEVLGRAPDRTRRAIILLSDGINTYGNKKLEDAVQEAIRNDAIVYAVGIGDRYYGGIDEGALRRIAERTGGRAFIPRDDERELRQAFAQIQTEMRSQYLIAYEPTNSKRDGSYRKIEIQLVNPDLSKQKVKLTYKQGYFSKNDADRK